MMHAIFKLLAPKNPFDAVLKVLSFSLVISACNYLFSFIYFGELTLSHTYIILNAFCVGGPFVVLFFYMLHKQIQLLTELAIKSRFDMMTGLPNRRWFIRQSQAGIQDSAKSVLMLLDADHFKRINDQYGHHVGDTCLETIADWLRGVLRTDDVIGRIGGEEFGVLLTNTTLDHAREIGREIVGPIRFFGDQGIDLEITLSIGAVAAVPGDDFDALLRLADGALYRAKANGRARMEVHAGDPPMDAPVSAA